MKDFLIGLFCGVIFTMMVTNANAGDCNGFRPFHGGIASQGAHAKASCTCDSCHTGGFSRGTAPTTCVGCHMGQKSTAMQKSNGHIPTGTSDCGLCHSPNMLSFDDARMNHTGITTGCASCHTKSSTHVATGLECTICHNTGFTSWSCSP